MTVRHRRRSDRERLVLAVNVLVTVVALVAAVWVLAGAGASTLTSCSMPAIRCR